MHKKYISIKTKSEFDKVTKTGSKSVANSIVLFSLRSFSSADVKLGLIVSKKNGNSVTRNKIKRRLRAAFTQLCECLSLKNLEVVLISRVSAFDVKFQDLVKDLKYCLKKSGAL